MEQQLIGILVMLNNYFHDLAVALLFCSLLLAAFLSKEARGYGAMPQTFVAATLKRFALVTKLSLVWVLVGGVIRTITYKDYEWVAAAGNGQVVALALKHLILVSLVALSLWLLLRERTNRRLEERRK
ncbi:MAG TPA: hypothetical protein VJA25_02410 [Dehalococcoidia bacterium]|nr:hypothetical protein [Dehalococcoidia bacterium]